MRNALNSLQATHAGFGHVNDVNVYKVRLRDSRCVLVQPAEVVAGRDADTITAVGSPGVRPTAP